MDTQFLAYLSFLFFGIIIGSVISFYVAIKIHVWMVNSDNEDRDYDSELHDEADFINTPFGRFRKSEVRITKQESPSTEAEAKGLMIKMASLSKYKADLDYKIKESISNENFLETATLKKHLEESNQWHEERRHFFESRLGKKIIANKLNCDCEACKESLLIGFELESEQEALHCFMLEIKGKLNGDIVEFRDI